MHIGGYKNFLAPFARYLPQRLALQVLFKVVRFHFEEADLNAETQRMQRFAEKIRSNSFALLRVLCASALREFFLWCSFAAIKII